MEQWDENIWERISDHFVKDFHIEVPDKNNIYTEIAPVRKLMEITTEKREQIKGELEREGDIELDISLYNEPGQLQGIKYSDIQEDMSYMEQGLFYPFLESQNMGLPIVSG